MGSSRAGPYRQLVLGAAGRGAHHQAGRGGLTKITIIAATTDSKKLPETILSRFKVRPSMEAYTDAEAARIAFGMATRIFDHPGLAMPSLETCVAVAVASNNNPRECDVLLTVLWDAALTGHALADEDGTYDLAMALEWQGTTSDVLTQSRANIAGKSVV